MTDVTSILLPTVEAAKLCGTPVRTWYLWDQLGKIPMPVRIGRKLYWRRDELIAWVDAECPDRENWIFRKPRTFDK